MTADWVQTTVISSLRTVFCAAQVTYALLMDAGAEKVSEF
jgi:hypothetical protein